MPKITMIAAADLCGGIGANNKLLWKSLPDDMARFRDATLGRAVVMGRKTYESIGRPLSGRANIVMTRDRNWKSDRVHIARSVQAAIRQLSPWCSGEIFVIGGAEIYRQFLPIADELLLTVVEHVFPEADTFFPPVDFVSDFQIVEEELHAADARHQFPFRFIRAQRVNQEAK